MFNHKKLIVALVFFLYCTSLFLTSSQPVVHASTIFSDDFENLTTTLNKWEVVGDTGWNINLGKYGIFLSPGLSNTIPTNENWNSTWTNIRYELDLLGGGRCR